MEGLQARMLGRFSIEAQGRRIDDSENRSQKPWLLLAYLLYHRGRIVTQEELLRLCWGNEEIKGDPANTLRVVLHRTRTMLDKLEVLPGRELILRSRDGFRWNERLPVRIDVEEFEALYAAGKAAEDPAEKRSCYMQAIDCYEGDFLSRNAGERWVQCMADRFRAMYMEMALETLDILASAGQTEQSADLCRRVLAAQPFHEEIYRRLMEALLELGQVRQATQLYEQLRERLLTEFDRSPEEATSRVYFKLLRISNGPSVPAMLEQNEQDGLSGTKVCDFTFFRMFYPSAKWLIVQCGVEMYHILFTARTGGEKSVSARTLERVMDNLTRQLCREMHKGGTLTKCAEDQLMAIMRADSYEDACLFCERQVEKFRREHPNAAVRLSYAAWRIGEA